MARKYLGGTQRPGGPDVGAIAWPAGGFADFEVLGNLGAIGWRSVILNSSLMPPTTSTSFTPSAITSALDGVDGRLQVALSDSTLSQVLADGPTAAQVRASARGRPSTAQASAAARLVRDRAALPGRDGHDRRGATSHPAFRGDRPAPPVEPGPRPGHRLADRERRRALAASGQPGRPDQREIVRRAGTADVAARGEVRPRGTAPVPAPQGQGTSRAASASRPACSATSPRPATWPATVAAVESSAWRGDPAQAKALLASVSAYLAAQDRQVRIIDTGQDTLTGKSGPVPVSINNRLGRPVTVLLQVRAPSDRMTVHPPVTTVTIGPHQQRTVVIKVRSAVARLHGAQAEPDRAQRGAPARDRGPAHRGCHPLRHHGLGHRGRRHRGIRRHRDRPGDPPGRRPRRVPVPAAEPGPGQDANGAEPTGSPSETDTVVSEPARDRDTPEEPDDYASAPGRVDRP